MAAGRGTRGRRDRERVGLQETDGRGGEGRGEERRGGLSVGPGKYTVSLSLREGRGRIREQAAKARV